MSRETLDDAAELPRCLALCADDIGRMSAPADAGGQAGDHADDRADQAGYHADDGTGPGGLTALVFPEIADWLAVLQRLAIPLEVAIQVAAEANVNGTDFQSELLVAGVVDEDALFSAMAAEIGLPYVRSIDAAKLIIREADCLAFLERSAWHVPVKLENCDGSVTFLVTPHGQSPAVLRKRVAGHPGLASRLKLTSPRRLRAAVMKRAGPLLSTMASGGMFERFPAFSARFVVDGWQGFAIGVSMAALPVVFYGWPAASFFGLHLFFTFFFLACVGLRFVALQQPPLAARETANGQFSAAEMPVYSVLVALYREAEIVPELIASLERIVWPRSKLDIKLVCEADDFATIASIRALRPPGHFEIVKVPASLPRTKPKALDYALPSVRGEFLVLYDAEDRPDPDQLIVAWRRFVAGGPDLACLQAPLEISNGHRSAVSRLFAFEYAVLFRGLLPWLSGRNLLMPLGGTSNHLRGLM